MENVPFSIPHLRKFFSKYILNKTQENQKTSEKHIEQIEQIWYLGHTDFEKNRFFDVDIGKIIFLQDDSIFFLVFFKACW